MKKYFSKEVKIAVSVLIGAAVLLWGINYLKGVNLLKPTNYYYVRLNNVEGLMLSAPVTIDGFKVGIVHEMNYDYAHPGQIDLLLNLDKSLRIPTGSVAYLVTDMLGTATIDLRLNKYVSTYYHRGDTIASAKESGLMDMLTDNILPSFAQIMPKLDSIVTGVQTLVADPALKASVKRLDAITANLEETSVALNRVMKNQVPTVLTDINTVVGNLNQVAVDLQQSPLKSTIENVNTTVINLKEVTEKMKSTDNTLGLLMNDRLLYDTVTKTIVHADSLLIDLKQNPKRYVHFSVF